MSSEVKNGKAWRTATLTGIPAAGLVAVLLTWSYSGGALKGSAIERISQNERSIIKLEKSFGKVSDILWDLKVDTEKIKAKLGVE